MWQSRRTWSSRLLTARASVRHWWGTSDTQGWEERLCDQVGRRGKGSGRNWHPEAQLGADRGFTSWEWAADNEDVERPWGNHRIKRQHSQHFPCPLKP